MIHRPFNHLHHVIDLRGMRAGDERCARSDQFRSDSPAGRSGRQDRFSSGNRSAMWARSAFSSGHRRVIHDHVSDTDVLARSVFEVVAADGEAVAVTAEQEHVQIRTREADAGGQRYSAPMDEVRAVGVDEIRKTRRASNAGQDDCFPAEVGASREPCRRPPGQQNLRNPGTRSDDWPSARFLAGLLVPRQQWWHSFQDSFQNFTDPEGSPSVLVKLQIFGSQYLARRIVASCP